MNESPVNLVISVLHHPYNWFKSSNARNLRETLEETSDIIITGHEHEADQYIRHQLSGEQSEYVEGGVLQDTKNPNISEFNILEIDIDTETQTIHRFKWLQKNRYEESENTLLFPLVRSSYRLRKEYSVKEEFMKYLNDPGATYTHRAKENILLDDIFLFPDFRLLPLPGTKKYENKII